MHVRLLYETEIDVAVIHTGFTVFTIFSKTPSVILYYEAYSENNANLDDLRESIT